MSALQTMQVRELRLSLFEDAVRKDLADIGDELVQRKKMGGGRSVKEKHIDDSWLLVGAIKKCECVPRILLKNGKRARNDLLKSQAKLREKRNEECQTTDVSKNVRNDALDKMEDDDGQGVAVRMLGGARPGADYMLGGASRLSADRMLAEDVDGNAGQELTCKSHGEGDIGAQSTDCQDAVFRSTVVESINALREEVANLRSEFTQIKKWGALLLCIMLEASCAHCMLEFRRAGLRLVT